MSERDVAEGLVEFLSACPTAFHAVAEMGRRLEEAGFSHLPEAAAWEMA